MEGYVQAPMISQGHDANTTTGPFQKGEEEIDHYARYDRIRSRRLDAEDMEDCWW